LFAGTTRLAAELGDYSPINVYDIVSAFYDNEKEVT